MKILGKEITFDRAYFERKKHDIVFVGAGMVLVIIFGYLFISSVSYLVGMVDDALSVKADKGLDVHFNLNDIKKLKLKSATTEGGSQKSTSAASSSAPSSSVR